MIESTSGAKSGAAGLGVVTLAVQAGSIDVAILLGAFAGSVVFVLSAVEYHWLQRLVYLFVSTVIAYQSAAMTSDFFGLVPVVSAIINGVLAIVLLNGLIAQGKDGSLLKKLFQFLAQKNGA